MKIAAWRESDGGLTFRYGAFTIRLDQMSAIQLQACINRVLNSRGRPVAGFECGKEDNVKQPRQEKEESQTRRKKYA